MHGHCLDFPPFRSRDTEAGTDEINAHWEGGHWEGAQAGLEHSMSGSKTAPRQESRHPKKEGFE